MLVTSLTLHVERTLVIILSKFNAVVLGRVTNYFVHGGDDQVSHEITCCLIWLLLASA